MNTDSGSYDKPGVDAVGGHIRTFLDGQGIASELTPDSFGDAITATVAQAGRGNRPVLLMGHRDTVFPKGEPTRRPFKIEGDRAYGPGVVRHEVGPGDELLRAGRDQAVRRGAGAGQALFTGDEEIGSPFSREVIEAHARGGPRGVQLRPGARPAAAVTGRKGGVFMRFDITGKAAHSGRTSSRASARSTSSRTRRWRSTR